MRVDSAAGEVKAAVCYAAYGYMGALNPENCRFSSCILMHTQANVRLRGCVQPFSWALNPASHVGAMLLLPLRSMGQLGWPEVEKLSGTCAQLPHGARLPCT